MRERVDIEVPLAWAVDAIGPVQPGVEPLRAVRRGHLRGQHEAHLVEIGAGVFLCGEILALPAPVAPCPGQAVEHLFGGRFADVARVFGQGRPAPSVSATERHRNSGTPSSATRFSRAGTPALRKVFLRDHVAGDLAPAFGHFDGLVAEHDRAIGVADFGHRGRELQRRVGVLCCRGEMPFDFHVPVAPDFVWLCAAVAR